MNLGILSSYYKDLCAWVAQCKTQIEVLNIVDLPPEGIACIVVSNTCIYIYTSNGIDTIDRENGSYNIAHNDLNVLVTKNTNFNTQMKSLSFYSHELKLLIGCFMSARKSDNDIPQPKTT